MNVIPKNNIPKFYHNDVQDWFRTKLLYSIYAVIFVCYVLIGTLAAHPYDDEVYAQHAQYFYYIFMNPAYNLPMGLYYDLINIGGYFVTILFSQIGISNLLTIQIGIKIPFIIFTFLTAYFLYKILENMGFNGHYASLLLLTSPIYIFTSVIYGSAIVVSMFFLVSSIYFILKRNNLVSAILFGLAAGSYLYPVFSVPFLLRYLYIREGRKSALQFFVIVLIFVSIGQLTVYYVYLISGYNLISPSSPSAYLSGMPVPYYSIFDIFNLLGISNSIPGLTYDIAYYSLALFSSFSYFFIKKEKINEDSLLFFLLIQAVLFAALNPYNLPSYMTALIPFAIIFAIRRQSWIIIGLIWVASVFSFIVIETVNRIGFLLYYADLNPKILEINNSFPTWLNSFAGVTYSALILSSIIIVIRSRPKGNALFIKSIFSQFSIVVVLAIVSLIIFAPVSMDIPNNFYYSNQENVFQASPVSDYLVGQALVVDYKVPVVGLLQKSSLNYFIGSIKMPSTLETILNTSENFTQNETHYSSTITLSFPVDNLTLELYGLTYGIVSAELVNNSETLSLKSLIGHQSSAYYTFKFYTSATLSGTYALNVSSSIPLYVQHYNVPSIFLEGSLNAGQASINGQTVTGNYIGATLLKPDTIVTFEGPFKTIPPSLPSFYLYQGRNFFQPIGSAEIIGGVIFAALVILPPLDYFYYKKK